MKFVLSVLQQNKALYNFHERQQGLLSRLGPRGHILYFPFVCILYIQGPFLRPMNSAVRVPSGSESYSSQWEIYFSQCLNKFLKLVEMEYLYKFITSKLKIHTDHADLVFN